MRSTAVQACEESGLGADGSSQIMGADSSYVSGV